MDINLIEIIKLIIPGIIGGYLAIRLQQKKNRPEIKTHGCRIMDRDVYTYFDPDNDSSEPACPYLSKEGECKFDPNLQNSKQNVEWDNDGHIKIFGIDEKKYILEVNKNKCYFTLWNQKTKTEHKKGNLQKIIAIIFPIFLVMSFLSTYYLFKLDQDTQSLYERKSSLDTAYSIFIPLDAYIRIINPWPGISDENLQQIYRNAYFFVNGEEPTDEDLNKVLSRSSYYEQIKELEKIPDTAKGKVLSDIKHKQKNQTITFWLLIISEIIVGIGGIISVKKE